MTTWKLSAAILVLSAVTSGSAIAQSAGPYYTVTRSLGNATYVAGGPSCNTGDLAMYAEAYGYTSSGAFSSTMQIETAAVGVIGPGGGCGVYNPKGDSVYCSLVCKTLEAGETTSDYYINYNWNEAKYGTPKGAGSVTAYCNGNDPLVGGGFQALGHRPQVGGIGFENINAYPAMDTSGHDYYYAGGYWDGGNGQPGTYDVLYSFALCKANGDRTQYYQAVSAQQSGSGVKDLVAYCENGDYPLISGLEGTDIYYMSYIDNDFAGHLASVRGNGVNHGTSWASTMCRRH